jgi:hypothetical protein
VPRPASGGSRFVGVVGGASGTSVSGALTGGALLFGLSATQPGMQFTGLRLGTGSLDEADLRAFDTLAFLGVCRIDLLTAEERGAVRGFVEAGGKLVLRDSNDSGACPGDDRAYGALGLSFTSTAPPDHNAPAGVQVVADSPLASADPNSPYFLDAGALSTAPYSAGDASYVTAAGALCASLVVAGPTGEQRVVRGWTNVGKGVVVYDGWDVGDGRKANAPLAKRLWDLDLSAPWSLPAACPALPPPASATPSPSPSASRTASPSPSPSMTATPRPSRTVTAAPTSSATPTTTTLPTATETATPASASLTPTVRPTRTSTPGRAPTATPRRSPTRTPSPTPTPTVTATPTITVTPTPNGIIPSSGGPDPYGYTYADSRAPGGPSYTWLDLTSLGTRLTVLDDANDRRAGPFPLGFDFTFYGQTFNEVYVDSNGLLSFVGPAGFSPPGNVPLVGAGASGALVAPLWDDLVTWHGDRCPTASVVSGVYTYGGGAGGQRFFAVGWLDVDRNNCPGDHFTFEVLLHADGRIVVQYRTLQGLTTSASVGIRSPDGSSALQYVYNAPGLGASRAVEFRPPAALPGDTPLLGTLRVTRERGGTPTPTPTPGPARATPSPTISTTGALSGTPPPASLTRVASATSLPSATPTPTPRPSLTATRTPTRTPTATPTRTATATPTRTPTRTPTATATRTPTRPPTRTPTPIPTATRAPTATPPPPPRPAVPVPAPAGLAPGQSGGAPAPAPSH